MGRSLVVRVVVACLVVPSACGSDPAAERIDTRQCSANWRIVFSPDQNYGSPDRARQSFAVHGDRLYLVLWQAQAPSPLGIFSVPISGGSASFVHEMVGRDVWVEDGMLFYLELDTLYRVPLEGGTREQVARTHLLDLPNGFDTAPLRLPDALYWTFYDHVTWTLWRTPRDGSQPDNLGAVASSDDGLVMDRLVPVGDTFVAVARDAMWTIARAGGAGQRVAVPETFANLLGVNEGGTSLWSAFVDGDQPRFDVASLPIDGGSATTPWPAVSSDGPHGGAWPDGVGGWYLATSELGTDGGLHSTVWALAGNGRAERLACDPLVLTGIITAVGTPNAFYAVVYYHTNYWEVVAIARP